MSDVVSATEIKTEVERGLRAYRAFENADKVLAYMANLEQQERELLARIAGLHSDAAKAEADAAQRIANAGQRAIDAETAALKVGTDAQDKAAVIVKQAEDAAAQLMQTAKQRAAQADEITAGLRAEAVALRNELAAGKAKLEQTEAAIIQARQQIKQLLKA